MPANELTEVSAALRRLLPPGVASSAGLIADAYPPLPPAERATTGRMSSGRLQEFLAGRAHARIVLQSLGLGVGLDTPVVPVGADRAPLWPQGFVGSISHAGKLVLAVAAPCTLLRALGVDLEPGLPLERELLNRVCRPEEVTRLSASPEPLRQAKLIFSAKESVYKCVAPLMGIFLEFADLEILFDGEQGQFCARGHGPAASLIGPDTVTGRFADAGGYWLTTTWQSQDLSARRSSPERRSIPE